MSTLLDPLKWGQAELHDLLTAVAIGPKPTARGRHHVVSAQHPLSAFAGQQALRAGGTAADACVTMVALDTVVLPGTSTLGGTLAALYHEVATGQTYALNAGLNAPLADAAPRDRSDRATGRAVLVPGVIAGLEALWRRFGVLPWADLWRPAIHFAREGFPLYPLYHWVVTQRRDALLRHPESRAIFAPTGTLPEPASLFRQPLLAATLERLAAEGAAYIYQGDWAAHLVAVVGRAGGVIGRDDLARYAARWDEPSVGTYLDYEVRTTAPPQTGGARFLLMLNIAEVLDLQHRLPRTESARTLYDEIQIAKAELRTPQLVVDPAHATEAERAAFTEALSKEYAGRWATRIQAEGGGAAAGATGDHSHQVAAIDPAGNMVTATHSVVGLPWGDAALFVGGIALNSGANAHAQLLPGERVVEGLSCYVVLRQGVPALAAGAIGHSLLAANLQNTITVLGHGLDLGQAIALPRWGSFAPSQRGGRPAYIMHVEAFDDAVLRAVEGLGQPVARAPYVDTGYWAAVGRDPATGDKCAVTEPRFLGLALGD